MRNMGIAARRIHYRRIREEICRRRVRYGNKPHWEYLHQLLYDVLGNSNKSYWWNNWSVACSWGLVAFITKRAIAVSRAASIHDTHYPCPLCGNPRRWNKERSRKEQIADLMEKEQFEDLDQLQALEDVR